MGRRVQLLVGCLLLAACGTTQPTDSQLATASPHQPSVTPTPSMTPTPTATATSVVHYDDGTISFDHPGEWPMISTGGWTGTRAVVVVVGTGSWDSGCVEAACTGSKITVDPGEVVAEFSYEDFGPVASIFELPPFESTVLDSGLPANIFEEVLVSSATIYTPGQEKLGVDVRFGSPPTDWESEAADAMIRSIAAGGGSRSVSIDHNNLGDGRGCARETLVGRLGRGGTSGLNILTNSGQFAYASWPQGWTAQAGSDERLNIVDVNGSVVAREWDEVELGGRSKKSEFRVCPESVRVVRSFPTS